MATSVQNILVVCLVIMAVDTSTGNVCVTRLVGRKFVKYCQNAENVKPVVLHGLKEKASTERANQAIEETSGNGATTSEATIRDLDMESTTVDENANVGTNVTVSTELALNSTDLGVLTTSQNISSMTPTDAYQVKLRMFHYGNVSDNCVTDDIGECFWTNISEYNYTQAQMYCSSHGAEVAIISNEDIYNAIVQDVRSKMPETMSGTWIWVGMNINSTTGKVKPEDAFYSWYLNIWPTPRPTYDNRVNIAIYLEREETAPTGMVINDAVTNFETSVACWKPPVSVTTEAWNSSRYPRELEDGITTT